MEYDVDYIWQDGLLTQQMLHYYLEVTIQGVTRTEEVLISSKFVYDESNQPVGCVANGEAVYAFVRNLQGDIIAVVDQDGETLVEYSYDPWGKVTSTHNGENLTELEASLVMVMCPFAYRGYNYDFTTGLYYLQSRYYNPEWGRFLNCDDTNILLATQGETLGANLFAYCNNNPVNRVDYTGKYSAIRARAYAEKWWDDYNPLYKLADKNRDCANFVSQCLYAGGFSRMTSEWYNIAFKVGYAWGNADGLKLWLEKRTTTAIISSKQELCILALLLLIFQRSYCSIVIIIDFQGDGDYDHAVINGYIDPLSLDIYYFAHSIPKNGHMFQFKRSRGKNLPLGSIFDKNSNAKMFISLLY